MELSVSGTPVPLERKPLEVLRQLLRHGGEVVTREEFISGVWSGRELSDSALAKAVSRVREVLGTAGACIRTVHGYGYRIDARIQTQAVNQEVRARPADRSLHIGDRPPLRPNWRLVERIQDDEAERWCAREERTERLRIFQFALNEAALFALRREVALYGLLYRRFGHAGAFAPVIDWNLHEPPFFLELEHLPAGDLRCWARSCGGLGSLSIALRIGLAAEIAEAVSFLHRVGAVHGDIRPANVLIELTGQSGRPHVRLAHIGPGITQPDLFEERGVAAATWEPSADARNYTAPEQRSEAPSSIQTDIYSVGVMLYQMVVGDFGRPLGPGWERDIVDESLRELLALTCAVPPAQRAADSADLARRLRAIEVRRKR